jgi:ribosome-binding protein aMBF1 (putative translation factor)
LTSRRELDTHFDRIDRILDTIRTCEALLDELMLSEEEREAVECVAVIPPYPAVSVSMALNRPEAALATDVATRIKAERKRKGWRQRDLSEATGIARPNIARLESGRRMPKITTLHKISKALGISVETLIGGV